MGGKRAATLLPGYGRLAHDVPKACGLGRGSRPRLRRTGSYLRSGRACAGYLGWSPVPRQQAADRSLAVGLPYWFGAVPWTAAATQQPARPVHPPPIASPTLIRDAIELGDRP